MKHAVFVTAFHAWYDSIRPVVMDEIRNLREREKEMAFYRLKRQRKARYRKQHDLFATYERNEFAD